MSRLITLTVQAPVSWAMGSSNVFIADLSYLSEHFPVEPVCCIIYPSTLPQSVQCSSVV